MSYLPAKSSNKSLLTERSLACVLVFDSNDPSGAGGLAADIGAIASAGAHALPVMAGTYARDTANIFEHFALDVEAVSEQARAVLEDIEVHAIKLGFVGTPENLGAVAGISADYAEVPLIAQMPDLSWWTEAQIDAYHDAFTELILPQTTVLIGSHSTLWRWLLPNWGADRPPGARDIAIAAGELGTNVTLVTGISLPDRGIDNVLTTPRTLITSARFDRHEGQFVGVGETFSATFAALIASQYDLENAFSEALTYLDQCLAGSYHLGMGHVVPDRLFWSRPESVDSNPSQLSSPATQNPQRTSQHDPQP